MKEIGGYFSLELNQAGRSYHTSAIKLNTARNALEYILRAKKYQKLYLPYYNCDVIKEVISRLTITVEYYFIDESFFPKLKQPVLDNEALLYINYFGLNRKNVERVVALYPHVIIDNSQAFFAAPLEGVDTFYSARKFLGVADGAYLYSNKKLETPIEQDSSYLRMLHLLKRIDTSAFEAYSDFKKNDKALSYQPIKHMSKITDSILSSINYPEVIKIRRDNFKFLHTMLKSKNQLNLDIDDTVVPMVYPLLVKNENLRDTLIKHKVYVATYWQNVLDTCKESSQEYKFSKYIVPLPVDQRYRIEDMERIIEIIFANWR